MRTLKRRERILGTITIAVLAGAVLFVWFIDPTLSHQAKLQKEVNQLEVSLTRMRANMMLKDQIESRYEELKNLSRASGSSSQEMSRFADSLGAIYDPLDLQIKSIRPLPDTDEGFYRKYSLRIEMVSTMGEMAKFLAAVAQTSEPIRVERIELTCKDRPDFVTAVLIVTRVVTVDDRPAANPQESRPQLQPAALAAKRRGP